MQLMNTHTATSFRGLLHAIASLTALLLGSCTGITNSSGTTSASSSSALPDWAAELERGIRSQMSVEIKADRDPNANRFLRLTMLISVTGTVRNQTGHSLRAGPGKGVIMLSTRPDSKPGRHPFPVQRDLLKGRAVSSQVSIEDWSNFALMRGGRVIAFRDNTVLAVCSDPLTVTVGGQSRRCVVVTHGFSQSADASVPGAQRTTFTGARTAVWPLDRAFLEGIKRGHPSGSALHEAAVAALISCP